MKSKQIGILLLVLTAVFLASSTIIMKDILILTSMTPGQVGIWRFVIAAPPLWFVYAFLHPSKRQQSKKIWKFLGLGLVFSISSFSALFALERLPSSIYILIVYLYPTFVVLFTLIAGGVVPKLFWLGLPMTLIGLLLVTYQFGSTLVVDPIGFLIALFNAIAMSGYIILSERVFRGVQHKISGTTFVLTGAMLTGLLLMPVFGFNTPDNLAGWGLLVSLGIFGTLLPILTLNIGLQYLGAARGSVIVTLQPVLAVLFSTIFLDETLSFQQWIGGLLVVVAVVLIQLSSDRN